MTGKRATPTGTLGGKAKAAKKTPAAKAGAKPKAAPKPKAEATGEKATRRNFGKNWLAEAIDKVCRDAKPDELPITVTTMRAHLTVPGTNPPEMPSTGAVSACLVRWGEQGYIKLQEKPIAFKGFTPRYKDKTLADFLADQRDKRKKDRAARKAA